MLDKFLKINQNQNYIDISMYQKTIIFDIVDPILVSFEDGFNVYVIYLIEHKKLQKRAQFLIAKSDYTSIEKVISNEKPLNYLFENQNRIEDRSIDLRRKKIEQKYISFEDADKCEYLPSDSFYLDKKYPNKVEMSILKEIISLQKKILDKKKELFKIIESSHVETNEMRYNYSIKGNKNNDASKLFIINMKNDNNENLKEYISRGEYNETVNHFSSNYSLEYNYEN